MNAHVMTMSKIVVAIRMGNVSRSLKKSHAVLPMFYLLIWISEQCFKFVKVYPSNDM